MLLLREATSQIFILYLLPSPCAHIISLSCSQALATMEDSQEAAASSVDPQKIQKAEELRLEGNAAFSAKKWNGAVKKYRASIDLDGSSPASAKVYSNLAAALCKLSKYDDAHEAAKKATEVDPDWAKGHWRLGVVNELQKDFLNSISCYMRASDLDPNEGTFVKAKEKMMKRLGCTEKKDADGNISMHVELPPTSTSFQGEIPALIAWSRLLKRTNNLANTDAYLPKRWEDKSEHWLQNALYQWYRGMFKQLGQLADLPDSKNGGITEKVEQLKLAAHAGQISVQQFSIAREKITGVPTAMGQEMDELMTGLTLLMGDHIPMETRDDGKERFVPSPPWLKHIRQKQMIAIQDLLCRDVLNLKMTGKNKDGLQVFDGRKSSDNEEMIVISPGLLAMANSFWAGTCGNESGIVAEEGTPEDVVAYIKKRLKGGVTWDENNGMRKYVSVVYRGTVLSAWLARVTLGLGIASRYFRWANKFIDLVDEEWKVTQSGDYSKYGNSFRKSFRVRYVTILCRVCCFLYQRRWIVVVQLTFICFQFAKYFGYGAPNSAF